MKFCGILKRRVIARTVLPLLAFGMPATATQASDWRFTAIRRTHYGTSLAFIDVASVKGGNGRVSFWASTYFSRRTRGMNRVNALVTANCSTFTYRFDRIVLFYNQRPLAQWGPRARSRAIPQTNVYDEISSACGGRDFGTHIGIPEDFAAAYFTRRQRG